MRFEKENKRNEKFLGERPLLLVLSEVRGPAGHEVSA